MPDKVSVEATEEENKKLRVAMKFMHKLQNVDNFDEIIKISLNKNFIHCLIDDLANEESMFTWEKRI